MLVLKGKGQYHYYPSQKKDLTPEWLPIDAHKKLKIPRVLQNGQIGFDKWKDKYEEELEDISSTFLEMVYQWTSETYICHFDFKKFQQILMEYLYQKNPT